MHYQSLLFPVVALAAFASASPLAARGTALDATCPSNKSVFFAIAPKNYLYGVYCDAKFWGGNVITSHTTNLLACAVVCDTWTNNNSGQICHAASFHPGQSSTANNCEIHTTTFGSDTDIQSDNVSGWESVQVTVTKVPNIQ